MRLNASLSILGQRFEVEAAPRFLFVELGPLSAHIERDPTRTARGANRTGPASVEAFGFGLYAVAALARRPKRLTASALLAQAV